MHSCHRNNGQVKILGVLAMIDDGELDWKMIAINSEDPLFAELNDIGDVETKCPGTISGKRHALRASIAKYDYHYLSI